jgi:hypothetical protein
MVGRTHVSKEKPSLALQIQEYKNEITQALQTYGPQYLFNLDETPLKCIAMNRKTIAPMGVESVPMLKTGDEKSQMTLVLCISASGDKLPVMVIKKGKTLACLSMLKLPADDKIIGKFSASGWIDAELLMDYLQALVEHVDNRPCCLIMDSYAAHWTEEVKDFCNGMDIQLNHGTSRVHKQSSTSRHEN